MRLSNKALSLWGKKQIENDQEMWLPLVAHMVDTKNVIKFLFNIWLNEGQRKVLRQNLSEDETEKLVQFVGYIHDIGKATPVFQTERSYYRSEELDDDMIEKLLRNGFEKIDGFSPSNRRATHHSIAGETILEKAGLNQSVGAIIGGHHGKPASKIFKYKKQLRSYTSNYYQTDIDTPEKENWKAVQDELIKYGLKQVGYDSLENIPEVKQAQAVILDGLLIMADWLASCTKFNGKPMFNLIPLSSGYYDIDTDTRFKNAINNWYVNGNWVPEHINDITDQYEKRWKFEPRDIQLKMADAISNINHPGMIITEAPMGIGKTEIALMACEQLAVSSQRNDLFFGLPTQATTNAMFSRINNWLKDISEDQDAKLNIKLMHGKAQFNDEYQKLPYAENISDQDEAGTVTINSWFDGKKSILTEFTVGTIDQLLLMGLKQKHLFLRHLGLSGKIVIIDEVHAYDTYMSSYLNKALEWLGAYHVPVIALSATLPKDRRKQLIESYISGKYGKKDGYESVNNWEDNQAYPLLTYLDGNEVKQLSDFSIDNKNKKVKIVRFNGDEQTIIDKALDTIKDGGIAGIIVNTVKRAQELKRLIPMDIDSLLLHSSFLAEDRSSKEQELEETIGKNGHRPHKMIVIGTQVLEQSLDIDFDVLFTDIAPIDLILQRIGRLHRHNIDRPNNLNQPVTYVLGIEGPKDYGKGNEAIYEKYILELTDKYLPNKISIPDDISTLVQKVYDDVSKLIIASVTQNEVAGLSEEAQEFIDNYKNAQRKAKQFQIASPYFLMPKKSRGTLHGWLDDEEQGIDINESRAEAAVRDIKETVEVILIKCTAIGDYLPDGTKIEDISIQAKEIARQIIRLPNSLTPNMDKAINILEELTMNRYSSWQENIWLKGELILPLDENMEAEFNGWKLKYSSDLGLSYEKL